MNALHYPRWGGPEALEPTTLPAPTAGPGQLRVKVHTISVNPIDWKVMSGHYRLVIPISLPGIPCFDICGTVDQLGEGVSDFAVGDRVFVREPSRPGGGARELATIDASVTVKVPEGISEAWCAAVPLAGMTALQALSRLGGLEPGRRVLIVGASGGVGHLAVQLASNAGAQVTGVCSARNAAFVSGLGASEVIDYTQRDDLGGPYDLIVDCVGSPWPKLRSALTGDGSVALIAPTPALLARIPLLYLTSRRRMVAVMMKPNRADLQFLADEMAAGRLRVNVEHVFSGLSALPDAMARSIAGRVRGKLVVQL